MSTFSCTIRLLAQNKSSLVMLIMEKMREKEIQEAIEDLKIERVNSYGARGKIISQWKLKTLLSGVEIDLGDASANIKTSHWEHLSEEEKEFAS